ncbi:uncharacterized protein LOC142974403 [Anticarsia gemmatalis]|uniref:uncharacterized protein LOC142974403 n=1 Tax=Anticarsia gemmatalis TaxID=129554 RepID=UPI003F7671F3
MSCGKRRLVKLWTKPKNLRVITPSRYEQNEASVKEHWINTIKALELSYKDEQFWDSQTDTVRQLVGPAIFRRIAKIFDLPLEATKYSPKSEPSTPLVPSEQFHVGKSVSGMDARPAFSISDYEPSAEEEEGEMEEDSEGWTTSSVLTASIDKKRSKMKAAGSKSIVMTKSLSKLLSRSFSRAKTLSKGPSIKSKIMKSEQFLASPDSSAYTGDDLAVHQSVAYRYQASRQNPHFEMLYCNESETDMIKWDSHYKQKAFEVSASDEFSKRAEILTKKIAKEFYDWWTGLGNVEFKSEIKRPEDIETLFQVWFDEHASRGIMLHPKIIPCVLKSIANYTGNRKASCPNALKRQVASDIEAETSPSHIVAFGTSLPQKKKHIPPRNNTEEMWHGVRIPEDLRSMACVWEDIQHLTSTKAFQQWLQKHPQLPMPPCFKEMNVPGDKKQLFVVPSDYVVKDKRSQSQSVQELALPVSQFALELKEVLSKLMNQ